MYLSLVLTQLGELEFNKVPLEIVPQLAQAVNPDGDEVDDVRTLTVVVPVPDVVQLRFVQYVDVAPRSRTPDV